MREDAPAATLSATLRLHAALIVIVAVYAGSVVAVAAMLGVPAYAGLPDAFIAFGGMFLAASLVYAATRMLRTYWVRPTHPLRYAMADIKATCLARERLFVAAPALIIMPIFVATFMVAKSMIPSVHPFSWDVAFSRMDIAAHGGRPPWQILHPLLGRPWLTYLINLSYCKWFYVIAGALYWQAVSLRNRELRMQYLITFVLSFIVLGTVMAVIFSSAGPCFYDRIGCGDDYAPLMTYLRTVNEELPVFALYAQEMLWRDYVDQNVGTLVSISAMPSMHISTVFLVALLGWRTHWFLGVGFGVFTVLTFLACVHLGYHYAIDCYVGVIGTWIIWRIVGWVLREKSPSG